MLADVSGLCPSFEYMRLVHPRDDVETAVQLPVVNEGETGLEGECEDECVSARVCEDECEVSEDECV